MTTTYRIENATSGHVFGTYEGETPDAAIAAMLADAGHEGPADDDVVAVAVELAVGDRVEAGRGDDADAGEIIAIDGEKATVAWDSLVETTQPLSMLRPEAE